MAHNVETMAYVGEVPWYGLGTKIEHGVSILEVGEKAGILWEVGLFPNSTTLPDGTTIEVPQRSLVRLSDNHVLDGACGPKYEPIQNEELLRFFEEYLEAGDMWIETAGSLQSGKIIWALAKMDKSFSVGKGDESEGYVLLANYHQYGKAGIAKFTAVRVVCNNTLTMALGKGSASLDLRMRHDRAFDEARRQTVKEQMEIAREQFDRLKEVGKSLAKMRLTEEDAVRIAAAITGGSDKIEGFDFESLDLKAEETFSDLRAPTRRVLELYAGDGMGSHLKMAKGTAWGMLGAVTQYVDFEAGRSDQDYRLTQAWFGRGNVVKERALRILKDAAAA